ncbi:effector-associated constant component EACC1 [Streptomyces xantholiticus]|uniref:ESX secretion-associated protein EspG n=1 Tax=Streptomyces xantholiticus TaxID=68285 RepID=A0ABV1V385_9ACTN
MRVRIDSDGTSEDSPDAQAAAQLTADFADWLAQDRAVGPHVEIRRIRPEPADGAMSGDLVAWLSLAISSGFSTTALVYAHKTFRASLPPRLRTGARMVIEHGDVRVVVENGTEQDAARIEQALATPQRSAGDVARLLAAPPPALSRPDFPTPQRSGGSLPDGLRHNVSDTVSRVGERLSAFEARGDIRRLADSDEYEANDVAPAADTVNHTLARLFIRLGPPPSPSSNEYAFTGGGDGGAQA